jgi:hypothetical protein
LGWSLTLRSIGALAWLAALSSLTNARLMAVSPRGQAQQNQCGGGLARDAGGSVCLRHRIDAIAGKQRS